MRANDDYDNDSIPLVHEEFLWSKVFDEEYRDFERLGIQGQFRSRIKSLNPVSGDYGYRLEVLSCRDELVNDATYNSLIPEIARIYSSILNGIDYNTEVLDKIPNLWYNKVATTLKLNGSNIKDVFIQAFNEADEETKKDMVYALLYANAHITEMYLNSSDMYGDPYNFQSFFEQEKVFDISSLKAIYGMTLFFYEKSATFLTNKGEQIPYRTKAGGKVPPNLHTKDPYICLGYDLSNFDSEQAILFTTDGSTYKTKDNVSVVNNQKFIRLRWLHLFENGNIGVVSESSNLSDYEIRWYRFRMGAPSADEYSGVYWDRVNEAGDNNDLFSYILNPAPNTSSEQIKAIVFYDNKVIRSNILTFTNEIEPASSATAELIAGLSIWCKDGSYGNYCRYGQNNQLMDSVQPNENIQKITADTVFTFEARFADKSILAENYNVDAVASMLHEAKEITWEFPLQNSMVIVQGFNYSYPIYDNEWINKEQGLVNYETLYANDDLNNGARYKLEGFYNDAIIKVRGNSVYIIRKCAEDGSINALQDYRINKTFNSSALNNTIKCTILRDGLIYSATKELTFGIMGTNGTDATVVIDFDNNKTALTANLDSETLKVTAHLYDSSHKEIDFQDVTNKNIECYWSWDSYMVEPGQDINIEQRLRKVDSGYEVADDTIPRNVCYLSHNTQLNIRNKNFFLVLKITIKGFGDYDLIAYKAIPIRADKRFRNIIGPTEIIYNTTGHPDYYKDKFTLWWCADENKITEYDTITDETAITNIASNWTIYNPYAEDSNLIGTISNNILKPATIYVKKADPYGAYCYLNSVDGGITDPVWIQPFVIIQNEYPSATINKWNGKEIKIDSDNGFILSPAIAAGSKDDQNRFYGVMIGDWSNDIASADITKQTGVYGFHEGALSFAFKEDGTAFIGKSGHGRIELDGNNGVLKSASWTDDHESGMYLDLDDGILKVQKEAGYDAIRIEAGEYQKGKYYVQKNTYSPVALNAPYDKTIVYYKKGLIALPSIDAANFTEKKNKGILYVQSKPVYKQCANNASFSDNTVYYQNNFIAVADVTEEIFKANKQRYYTESDGIYTKLPNDAVFTEGVVYYTQGEGVSEVHITKEQFEKNPSQFYYLEEQTIGKVANNASFDPELKYYQEGYLSQTYGLSSTAPYPEWNTSEDSQLENGETYYTLSESTYVVSNDIYDPGQTYYVDNTSEEARYITLSAAERTFPLSIGTDALEDNRKFRVAWDGTCYIEDGEFSGNINAETGTLGELTLTGWLNVVDGAHINVDNNGFIYVGKNGFIDLDKNAFITMNKGGFLQLSANGGHIKCDKLTLDDVATQGFWLDKEGFHIGDYSRYFYSSPNAIGFYSNMLGYDGNRITYFPGSLRMSGHALDMYCSAMEEGWGADESQLIQAAKNGLAKITSQDFYDEGQIRIGWEPNRTYFHPYLRLGFGTYVKGATTPDYYMADAAVIKKYTGGIWIGNYGYGNYIGDGGTSLNNPFIDPRIYCGMFCYTGSHYLTYSTASKKGPEWGLGDSVAQPEIPTVFRCEVIPILDSKGVITGYKTIYEPARYARFA